MPRGGGNNPLQSELGPSPPSCGSLYLRVIAPVWSSVIGTSYSFIIEVAMTPIEEQKLAAEIAHLMAQTAKLNKELRWYEVTIIIAMTLAVVAIAKVFL